MICQTHLRATTLILLMSHLSDAYEAFSSLLSPMKMSLTNLAMKVLGPGSPPVHAYLNVLNYMLIVLLTTLFLPLAFIFLRS